MKVTEFSIPGLKLIELKSFPDSRGFFCERYKKQAFHEIGIQVEFIQDNFSRSIPKTLRGLHYQFQQPQSKLITAISGRIFDVAVDIRQGSPTYGQHAAVELDGQKPSWFWIPAGFAHGFCVIGDQPADVLYKVDQPYGPQGEGGILWCDKDLNIQWPIQSPLLSPKDEVLQSMQKYTQTTKFKF